MKPPLSRVAEDMRRELDRVKDVPTIAAGLALMEFVAARETAFRAWAKRMVEAERSDVFREVAQRFPGAEIEDVIEGLEGTGPDDPGDA